MTALLEGGTQRESPHRGAEVDTGKPGGGVIVTWLGNVSIVGRVTTETGVLVGGVTPEPGAVAGGVMTSGACSGDPRAASLAFNRTISASFSLLSVSY